MSGTKVPAELRRRISEQARRRCGYCLTLEMVIGCEMEVDHLVPEARGGSTEEQNLWLACSPCNGHKNDRMTAPDPSTGEVVLLFNPRRQEWTDHFEWAEGGVMICGRTPIGRATVQALHLNRPPIVTARRLWVSAGWHPPKDGVPA